MRLEDVTSELRRSLASELRSSQAHAGLQRALEGLSFEDAGRRLEGHRHTAWELVEHLRRAAEDLVEYCRNEDYRMPSWPDDFWPDASAPADADAWRQSREGLRVAVEAMASLVENRDRPLFEPVPGTDREDHHLVRAALVLLDHDAYHVGQLVALRRGLDLWPPGG